MRNVAQWWKALSRATRQAAHWWNGIGLITRIVIGLIIGAVLGLLVPQADAIDILGSLFVSALKSLAPILVFFLVISALATARAEMSMRLVVLLYIVSTLVAAIVAVLISLVFPVTLTLTAAAEDQDAPSGIGEVLKTLVMKVVSNPVESLGTANYLGILAWAIILGIALRHAGEATKTVLSNVADAIGRVVRWVINCAPFGILGLVFTAVATSGLSIFTEYGKLLAILVGAMVFIALVANPLMVFLVLRKNPYPLVLRCLKDSGVTAFFTRSSAANIPVNLDLCRRLGLNRDNYSVSIPLGATVNMAGAAVTITVMAMAAAHTLGISVDLPTAVILSALAAVSACGASGVAGGSLLLIPLACSLFGISNDVAMQVVAIGFIIGVVQDSCETALNSSSDALFTATAEYRFDQKHDRPFAVGQVTD
jgi:serine/threonine transporter